MRYIQAILLAIQTILLAIIVGLIIVTATYGQCVENSEKMFRRGVRWGYEMRLRRGYIDEGYHQWAEYWNEKRQEWCLWETRKSWYTAEETGYLTEGSRE